jgi:hypothetical protein
MHILTPPTRSHNYHRLVTSSAVNVGVTTALAAELEDAAGREDERQPQGDRGTEDHPDTVAPVETDTAISLVTDAVAHDGDEDDVDDEDGSSDHGGEDGGQEGHEAAEPGGATRGADHEEREDKGDQGQGTCDRVQDKDTGQSAGDEASETLNATGSIVSDGVVTNAGR